MITEQRELVTRLYDEDKDHTALAHWWTSRGMAALPPEMLPKVGCLAVEGDERIAAAFLYQSDAQITWLTWLVANPNVDAKRAHEGLGLVIESLWQTANALGYKVLMTSLGNSGLIKVLERNGFQKTGEVFTELIRSE